MACANRYVQLNDLIMKNAKVLQLLLPRIVEAYVEGRLNQINNEDDNMNPLEDPEALHEEMTQFPQIVRFVYQTSGEYLVKRMEGLMESYEAMHQSFNSGECPPPLMREARRGDLTKLESRSDA